MTREHGVGLFIHFSGVWDSVAVEKHPEWARVDAEGKRDIRNTSTFGPYVDELLIPQLKEVTDAYDLDGLWVDGECWSTQLDYSPAALKAWKKETGYQEAPKKRSEPHWLEWKMFHRRQFEKYLCHWVDALHEHNPKLQITSNWMYTTFAPKPVVANLDYLSGDYSPGLSVDRARVEARYLASTGMPWDLMAWGFDKGEGLIWSWKTPIHLQQEASAVLMQGGGFQIYYQPTRRGHVPEQVIETIGQVSDFCRPRQAVSHKSVSVPQVALLLSSESMWDSSDRVFAPWGGEMNKLEGALHALLELNYSVDILAEHQLQPRLDEFPLVVVPDSHKLSDDFKNALLAYTKEGGSLLLFGDRCARLFESELGVRFEGKPEQQRVELASASGIANANGAWQAITPTNAIPIGFHHPTRDRRKDGSPASTITYYGKGKIGAIYGPLATIYFNSHHPHLRQFVGDLTEKLFPKPAVHIDGPPCLDIALRKTRDGRLSLHLLNRSNLPLAKRFCAIDFIPQVGPFAITMEVSEKPRKVQLVPDGGRLKWTWKKGALSVMIPSIHVHSVLVIE